MNLKRRLQKLEDRLGVKSDFEEARNLVMFAVNYGIIPETVDIESIVHSFASRGITMKKIIEKIYHKANGLPPLPCKEMGL